MKVNWIPALELEQKVAGIIQRQEDAGFQFDKEMELTRKYKPHVREPWKKSGDWNNSVVAWYTDDIPDIGGPFSRVDWEEPSLSKRAKIAKQLLRLGWKPEWFTEIKPKNYREKKRKGGPQMTRKGVPAPSLNKMSGTIGKDLSLWFTYSHRQSQINGWLNGPASGEKKGISPIRKDGRIPARANSLGTPTARMTHSVIVNVPKAKSDVIYGKEMRSLFIARKGYKLVGHDASGLEARMEAHYTFPFDGGEYAREILEGDIHTKNMKIFQVEAPKVTRDLAKNGKYCLTYGGQPPRLAITLGCSKAKGQILFDSFWEGNFALNKLREKLERFHKKHGWIPGLDGRKIQVRSKHTLVNTLFQSAGAIVMKRSLCFLDDWIREEGLDVTKVIDQHDEGQAEVHPKDVKRYSELAVLSIVKAGEYYNLRCPLDAEAKVGNSWDQTH